MTPTKSVFGRHTDALQASRGIFPTVYLCAVVWGVGFLLLHWALR